MPKTAYEILDTHPDAKAEEIAFAYRRAIENLSRAENGDPRQMDAIRKAYETLRDPTTRADYDRSKSVDVNRLRQQRENGGELEEDSGGVLGGWGKWLIGIAVLLAMIFWWKSRKHAEAPVIAAAPVAAIAPTTVQPPPVAAPRPAENDNAPVAAPLNAEQIYARVAGSVAKIIVDANGRPIATGSGVVIAPGTVITNCHVTRNGTGITVKLGNESYSATVTIADEVYDLCKLNVPGLSAPPVPVGSVKTVRAGQKVVVIGSPYGLESTLSEGLVSALRETPEGTVIQTSAAVSPGSSGGGLFDNSGTLVGIITFQHRYGQNLNFAVPADWINDMQDRRASATSAVPAQGPSMGSTSDQSP